MEQSEIFALNKYYSLLQNKKSLLHKELDESVPVIQKEIIKFKIKDVDDNIKLFMDIVPSKMYRM